MPPYGRHLSEPDNAVGFNCLNFWGLSDYKQEKSRLLIHHHSKERLRRATQASTASDTHEENPQFGDQDLR
jgi:hypothetical protein